MRVSTNEMMHNSLYAIETAYSNMSTYQNQLSSGKRINNPSDDPVGIQQLLTLQQSNSNLTQYGKMNSQAVSFLSNTDSALSSVNDLLNQARTLAVQAANSSFEPLSHTALVSQIGEIITQVSHIGNTNYSGRYIFAGQLTQTMPIANSGGTYTYQGGSQAAGNGNITLEVGANEPMAVNVSGDQVFTPLLNTLQTLQNDVASGNTSAISQTDIANLDTQLNNLLTVRGNVGAKIDQLNQQSQQNGLVSLNNSQMISQIGDTNMAQAIVSLQSAQTAYQAALSATSHTYQDSLLKFLG